MNQQNSTSGSSSSGWAYFYLSTLGLGLVLAVCTHQAAWARATLAVGCVCMAYPPLLWALEWAASYSKPRPEAEWLPTRPLRFITWGRVTVAVNAVMLGLVANLALSDGPAFERGLFVVIGLAIVGGINLAFINMRKNGLEWEWVDRSAL